MTTKASIQRVLSTIFVLFAGSEAGAQSTAELYYCKQAVISEATRFATDLARLVAACHRERIAGRIDASVNCNDVESAAAAMNQTLPETAFRDPVDDEGAECEAVAPSDLLYTSCPFPCESGNTSDWASVDQCFRCVMESRIEEFAASSIGLAAPPLDLKTRECANAVYMMGDRLIPLLLREHLRCERENWLMQNRCLLKDKFNLRKIAKLKRKLAASADRACLGANMAAIGACASTATEIGCALAEAQSFGELISYDASRLQGMAVGESVQAFAEISTGTNHNCGLRTDGTAYCWGNDDLGRSTTPPGIFLEVAAGSGASCGLRGDGSIECWGYVYPPPGQFTDLSMGGGSDRYVTIVCGLRGDGSVDCRNLPNPTGVFTRISVGLSHACGLRPDNTVECWGDNAFGQSSPPPGEFSSVDCGGLRSCGLRPDGSAECWGIAMAQPPGSFTQVSVGEGHACGLRASGAVECWGLDFNGETAPQAGPFVEVQAGGKHTCGRLEDQSVRCWGRSTYGESSPPARNVADIAVSTPAVVGMDFWTCSVGLDGLMDCWGNDTEQDPTPPPGVFTTVSTGPLHACATRPDGTAECWGADEHGETLVPPGDYVQVEAGVWFSCGLRIDGSLDCWGYNDDGRATPPAGLFDHVSLGSWHGCTSGIDISTVCWGDALSQPPPPTSHVQLASGPHLACGVEPNGTVSCWGGTNVAPPGRFSHVSAGYTGACGVRTGGALDCWGPTLSHMLETPAGEFTQVEVGGSRTCAIRRSGREVCWGTVVR